jgi:hypothetical protein
MGRPGALLGLAATLMALSGAPVFATDGLILGRRLVVADPTGTCGCVGP